MYPYGAVPLKYVTPMVIDKEYPLQGSQSEKILIILYIAPIDLISVGLMNPRGQGTYDKKNGLDSAAQVSEEWVFAKSKKPSKLLQCT